VPGYDQHLHSRHSFDCRTEPRENVEAAIGRGLRGLTFTEHFDTHPDDWKGCTYNDEAYTAAIEALRREFGSAIFVGKGIEVCFQPATLDFVLEFLAGHKFDLVMLSIHYFGDVPVHSREHWTGLGAAEGTKRYLETVLEAVRTCERIHRERGHVFDVLGHLDVVKRYSHRFAGSYDVAPFADLIDQILLACLAADLVPEINTSSLRQGLTEAMPNTAAIRRYAELGGQAVSIGSDAHRSVDIGADFDVAANMLREAGFGRLAVFKDRKKQLERLHNGGRNDG